MKFWHGDADTVQLKEEKPRQFPEVHSFQKSGTVHIRHDLNMIISSQMLIRMISILREWIAKNTLDSIDQVKYEMCRVLYL